MARNNKLVIPEDKKILDLDKFNMEAAKELEVNLKDSYHKNLVDRKADQVSGKTVEKMIEKSYEEELK